MPSKKSQLSLKLILIPYSFRSFKQKMVFMRRNNPHIQSQIQPCSHIAKPSRSRLFLRFVHAQPYSNTGPRDQFGPGDREAGWPYISLSLPRTVLIYTYCPCMIINSTPFTLKSIPVEMINQTVNLLIPQITNYLNDPFPKWSVCLRLSLLTFWFHWLVFNLLSLYHFRKCFDCLFPSSLELELET